MRPQLREGDDAFVAVERADLGTGWCRICRGQGCTGVIFSALRQRSALNLSDCDGEGEGFSAHQRSTLNRIENGDLHCVFNAFAAPNV
jgi:hypothetical protein